MLENIADSQDSFFPPFSVFRFPLFCGWIQVLILLHLHSSSHSSLLSFQNVSCSSINVLFILFSAVSYFSSCVHLCENHFGLNSYFVVLFGFIFWICSLHTWYLMKCPSECKFQNLPFIYWEHWIRRR